MKNLRSYLVVAASTGVLTLMLAFTNAGPAVADAMRPLLVRDVDNPARLAIQVGSSLDWEDGSTSTSVTFPGLAPIPAGKTLVVEFVSVRAHVPPGQKVQASFFTW